MTPEDYAPPQPPKQVAQAEPQVPQVPSDPGQIQAFMRQVEAERAAFLEAQQQAARLTPLQDTPPPDISPFLRDPSAGAPQGEPVQPDISPFLRDPSAGAPQGEVVPPQADLSQFANDPQMGQLIRQPPQPHVEPDPAFQPQVQVLDEEGRLPQATGGQLGEAARNRSVDTGLDPDEEITEAHEGDGAFGRVVPVVVDTPSGPQTGYRWTPEPGMTQEQLLGIAQMHNLALGRDIVPDPSTGSYVLSQNGLLALRNAGAIARPTGTRAEAGGFRLVRPPRPTGGSGLGRNYTEMEFERGMTAPVDPMLSAEIARLGGDIEHLRQQHLKGTLNLNELQAQGMHTLSQMREAMAQETEQRDAGRSQQLRQRMGRMDRVLDAVRENRVDPERFFGGTGGPARRLGSAVAVALGSLASAHTGGPNTALQIIQSRIDADIQAQTTNQANLRSAAGLEQNAFAQFRSILGDEAAAEAATRAAHWEAAVQQLQSLLTNARRPIMAAGGQALIVAARMEQLQAMAEAQKNAWSATVRERMRVPLQGVARQAMSGEQPQQPGPAQAPGTSGRRPRPRLAPPPQEGEQAARLDFSNFASRPVGEGDRQDLELASRLDERADEIDVVLPTMIVQDERNRSIWRRMDEQDRRDMTTAIRTQRNIETVARRLEGYGSTLTGNERVAAQRDVEMLMGEMRQVLQMGALTGSDYEIVQGMMPRITGVGLDAQLQALRGGGAQLFAALRRATRENLDNQLGVFDLDLRRNRGERLQDSNRAVRDARSRREANRPRSAEEYIDRLPRTSGR
jgi:hypothetical protein